MATVRTSKIAGGADYAGVADRLKEFRETNPRAKVSTVPTFNQDGSIVFQATIIADKSDEGSAEATGTAFYNANDLKKAKSFEKLETIAVGRALALLGYLNNGEIASTEEMEEFNEYKAQKAEEAIYLINESKDMESLKNVFMSLGTLMSDAKVITAKDMKKLELQRTSK